MTRRSKIAVAGDEERRDEQRARVCVWTTELRGPHRFSRLCMDLSPSGAFLACAFPPASGEALFLQLELEDGRPPIPVTAELENFQNKYGVFGVGVGFIDTDAAVRDRIRRYVREIVEETEVTYAQACAV